MDQVYGGVPPEPDTIDKYAVPVWASAAGQALIEIAGATEIVNDFSAVVLRASVTRSENT